MKIATETISGSSNLQSRYFDGFNDKINACDSHVTIRYESGIEDRLSASKVRFKKGWQNVRNLRCKSIETDIYLNARCIELVGMSFKIIIVGQETLNF